MTRSTPDPDSGAAASRDAARSAIRLTDETRPPRRHLPETSRNGPAPEGPVGGGPVASAASTTGADGTEGRANGTPGGGAGAPVPPVGADSGVSAAAAPATSPTTGGVAGQDARPGASTAPPGAPNATADVGPGAAVAAGGGGADDRSGLPSAPAAAGAGVGDRPGSAGASVVGEAATAAGARVDNRSGSSAASAVPSGAPVTAGGVDGRSGVAAVVGAGPDARPGGPVASAGASGVSGAAVAAGAGADRRPGSSGTSVVGEAATAAGARVDNRSGSSAASAIPSGPVTAGGADGRPGAAAAAGAGPDARPGGAAAPAGAPAPSSGAAGRPGSPAASRAASGAPNATADADNRPGSSAAGVTADGPDARSGVTAAAGGATGAARADARAGSPGAADALGGPGARPDVPADWPGSPWAPESSATPPGGTPKSSGARGPAGSVTAPGTAATPGAAGPRHGKPAAAGTGPDEGPGSSAGRHARPGAATPPDASKTGDGKTDASKTDASKTGDGRRSGMDLRRIIRAGVGVIAVPVAAEAHTVPTAPTAPAAAAAIAPRIGGRRKTVIGTETTGSIPVHLLFRDEPEPDDDGGPATIAMAPPVVAKAVIPAPTRPESSRPAPTADPDLVERDGAVLPGWIGVVGGLLALAGCAAVLWWAGAVPGELARMLRVTPRPYHGIHLGQWALLALGVLAVLFTLGGLGRGRVGYAWVLSLFGDYRGSVRRTGLVWISPLLLRRRVDVRLRHWRSEPLSAVDAKGTALRVVVLVVWRVRDTVRAALGVEGHEEYLREQVEAAMARVLSQLPADAFHDDAPTLRDAEAVGEALTRMLSAECAPVGIDVFSAQPTRIEYAPEVAAAMQRRRIAAIDAKHRDSVLTSVVDAVDDVVHRLTTRGLVELDDYERKALVKDLTVAFYTGRTGPVEGA